MARREGAPEDAENEDELPELGATSRIWLSLAQVGPEDGEDSPVLPLGEDTIDDELDSSDFLGSSLLTPTNTSQYKKYSTMS